MTKPKTRTKKPTLHQLHETIDWLTKQNAEACKVANANTLEASRLRALLEAEREHDVNERKRAHTAAADRINSLEATLRAEMNARDNAEAKVERLRDELDEAQAAVRNVAAIREETPAQPVNEHADAHETISALADVIASLSEARTRALRAAAASTTETELRAALGDALDLLFSDAVSFVDGSGPLLARGIRDRAMRLGCGSEEV